MPRNVKLTAEQYALYQQFAQQAQAAQMQLQVFLTTALAGAGVTAAKVTSVEASPPRIIYEKEG